MVDVNGDGLPDVVGFANDGVYVSENTGAGLGAPTRWVAAFGAGQGWYGTTAFAGGSMGFSRYGALINSTYSLPRTLADVNGDGLPDVVGFANDGTYVSFNTGTSFGSPGQATASYGANGWADENTYPRMLVDVKGTGFAGIVGFASTGVYASPGIANVLPDLVSSVVNGLGATTTISYVPATNGSVVTKGTGTAFPMLDLVAPLYVVSRVDSTNGVGGVHSATYHYSGGRLDIHGRGFLGFAQNSATDLRRTSCKPRRIVRITRISAWSVLRRRRLVH